jgi:uncharacterized protein YjbJ (UPF0337 family)
MRTVLEGSSRVRKAKRRDSAELATEKEGREFFHDLAQVLMRGIETLTEQHSQGNRPSEIPLSGLPKEDTMDWNRVEGNWKQIKGKVKEQWGKLTDDDLDVINGKQDQLQGKLQERYGYAKDQAEKEVGDWYGRQTW